MIIDANKKAYKNLRLFIHFLYDDGDNNGKAHFRLERDSKHFKFNRVELDQFFFASATSHHV